MCILLHWLWFVKLVESNESDQMQAWFPGMILIGSDGGRMGYAVKPDGQCATFDRCVDYVVVLSNNIASFIEYIYTFDWALINIC